MLEKANPAHDSAAVQTHLSIMQGVIQRMAENSRSCKVWCVTLVSATLILVAQTGKPQNVLIALVPAVLLLILDTYYLALERGYRDTYGAFVQKLHSSDPCLADLYVVSPNGVNLKRFAQSLTSFSIWPFYLMVGAMVLLAWWVIVP